MIRGVLLDLSGVLYVGQERLPGALESVAELTAAGVPLRYITNTTRSPRAAILAKLARMGFLPFAHAATARAVASLLVIACGVRSIKTTSTPESSRIALTANS